MEEQSPPQWGNDDHRQLHDRYAMSPEIIEIGEESKSITNSRDGSNNIYVAVGKDDLDVLKWCLNHAVTPGSCVFLIHVFPPVNYIPTPVGRISRSQVSKEQLRIYLRDENTRRRNLLQKYIRMCNDAKVTVDTILIESNLPGKAILELIPVLNISMLVMGTKRAFSRRLKKGMGKGDFVQKNAPEFCEVTIVSDGKKLADGQQTQVESPSTASSERRAGTRDTRRKFFDCVCFTGKFD